MLQFFPSPRMFPLLVGHSGTSIVPCRCTVRPPVLPELCANRRREKGCCLGRSGQPLGEELLTQRPISSLFSTNLN